MPKIVFVCLGNVYRSIYAEKRLKELIERYNIKNIKVSSAGLLHIEDGDEAQIKRVKEADLILLFEEKHKKIIKGHANKPNKPNKPIFTLKEFALNEARNKDIRDPIHYGNPDYKEEIDKCIRPLLIKIKEKFFTYP